MDKLPPAISMFVSTVSTTIYYQQTKVALPMAHLHQTHGAYYRTATLVEDGELVRRSSTGRKVGATCTSAADQTVRHKYVRVLAPF